MIQFTEEQDKAAREWNEAFDYRALRNGVQCGNILMLHLDKVNKRAMELYAAQQVAAERERIKINLKTLLRAAWWLGADNHDNPQSGFENWYEREQPVKKLIDSL